MNSENPLAIAAGIIAAAGTLVTIIMTFAASRRAQYERVQALIDYATTSEVAARRHRLGLAVAAAKADSLILTSPKRDELVDDLFQLLWVFDKIHAQNFALPWYSRGPRRLLRLTFEGWVRYWELEIRQKAPLPCALGLHDPDVKVAEDNGLQKLYRLWLEPPARDWWLPHLRTVFEVGAAVVVPVAFWDERVGTVVLLVTVFAAVVPALRQPAGRLPAAIVFVLLPSIAAVSAASKTQAVGAIAAATVVSVIAAQYVAHQMTWSSVHPLNAAEPAPPAADSGPTADKSGAQESDA